MVVDVQIVIVQKAAVVLDALSLLSYLLLQTLIYSRLCKHMSPLTVLRHVILGALISIRKKVHPS